MRVASLLFCPITPVDHIVHHQRNATNHAHSSNANSSGTRIFSVAEVRDSTLLTGKKLGFACAASDMLVNYPMIYLGTKIMTDGRHCKTPKITTLFALKHLCPTSIVGGIRKAYSGAAGKSGGYGAGFMFYEEAKRQSQPYLNNLGQSERKFFNALIAFQSGQVANLFENFMVKRQAGTRDAAKMRAQLKPMQAYASIAKHIFETQGLRGFARGGLATGIRDTSFFVCLDESLAVSQTWFSKKFKSDHPYISFVSPRIFAAGIATIGTQIPDWYRTRLQHVDGLTYSLLTKNHFSERGFKKGVSEIMAAWKPRFFSLTSGFIVIGLIQIKLGGKNADDAY